MCLCWLLSVCWFVGGFGIVMRLLCVVLDMFGFITSCLACCLLFGLYVIVF